jgi:hypothetical protein
MASKQRKELVHLFKRMRGAIAADPHMSMAEIATQRTPGSERSSQ